jgi:alanyl-tRNA synthetase
VVEFVGYEKTECETQIIKYRRIKAKGKEQYQLVFSPTPFYAESGGQVGDTGVLTTPNERIEIIDTKKENNLIVHYTNRLPENINTKFTASVNVEKRKNTASNHSATHLLHAALRSVLGGHVEQKGSLVNDEYLRFDFSHFAKVSDEEIAKIECIVNEKIRENIHSDIRTMSLEDAKKTGAMALFGEKYGDTVRVVTFDENYSIELCGGTHVNSSGQLGFFKITSEGAVAAGIRRIEAITGKGAEGYINSQLHLLGELKETLKNPKDLIKSLNTLLEQNTLLIKQIEDFQKEKAVLVKHELKTKIKSNNGVNIISDLIKIDSADVVKDIAFQLKGEVDNLFLVIGAEVNGKANVTVMISDNLVKEKNLHAGNIIKEISKEINGGGGGQAFYATAGGTKIEGLKGAIERVLGFLN